MTLSDEQATPGRGRGAPAAIGCRRPSGGPGPARPPRCGPPPPPGAPAGYRVIGAAVKGEAARQLAADAGIEADTVALLLTRADAGQQRARRAHRADRRRGLHPRRPRPARHAAPRRRDRRRRAPDRRPRPTRLGARRRQLRPPRRPRRPTTPRSSPRCDRLRDAGEAPPGRTRPRRRRSTEALDRTPSLRPARPHRQRRRHLRRDARPLVPAPPTTATRTRWCTAATGNAACSTSSPKPSSPPTAPSTSTTPSPSRDGRRLAVGDEVIARHGDRSVHPAGNPTAWMRNGTTGRIVAVHPGSTAGDDRITIDTAGGTIVCGRAVFDRRRGGIDLGYAVTSYAVQGSTRDASTSAITATTARSELYVDITRGRDSNQLYATRTADTTDAEAHLPQLDPELLTDAARPARPRHPRPGAGHRPRTRSPPPGPARPNPGRADRRPPTRRSPAITPGDQPDHRRHPPPGPQPPAGRAVARSSRAAPVTPSRRPLGRPRRRRRRPHRHRRPPRRRRRPSTPLEQVLGATPERPDQTADRWDRLADRLVALAVDIAMWHLQRTRPTSAPLGGEAWLRPPSRAARPRRAADRPRPRRPVPADRRRPHLAAHPLDRAGDDALGPIPDDPAQRARTIGSPAGSPSRQPAPAGTERHMSSRTVNDLLAELAQRPSRRSGRSP